MVPPLTILALENVWVHVCSSNGSNVVAYVEASVDEHFDITATLYIPYINPNDCHVRFQRDFDNSRL